MIRLPALVSVSLLSFVSSLAAQESATETPAPAAPAGNDWPQWRGPTRDGVWLETGLLREFPDEFTPKWKAPIGSGYSGPTVAKGRVYVMDRVTEPKALERVQCFAWDTGKPLWSHEYAASYGQVGYQAGPRCSVLIADGRAYSLGTMGHLFCFDAASGEVKWSVDLDEEYDIRIPPNRPLMTQSGHSTRFVAA